MGLGRARHCVYHELPSDSHMGDIRETLPGRMGAQTPGGTLVSASSDGSKNSKMGVGCVCVCYVQTPALKAKHRAGAQLVVLL